MTRFNVSYDVEVEFNDKFPITILKNGVQAKNKGDPEEYTIPFDFGAVAQHKEEFRRAYATNEIRSVFSGFGKFHEPADGSFFGSSKWYGKEFIILSNIGIHRFKENQYDTPFKTIEYTKDMKIIDAPTYAIESNGNLI